MKHLVLLSSLTLGLCAAGWTMAGALATMGWTQEQLEAEVRDQSRNMSPSVGYYSVTKSSRQALIALNEEGRAAVVREVGGLIKTLVRSQKFQKAHDDFIKETYNAVNHGLKVKPEEAAEEASEEEQQKEIVVQMAMSIRELPVDALEGFFSNDLQNWASQAEEESGQEKARFQKLLARAREIEPWMKSKPEEFKKAYTLLKSIEQGGPSTEAELQAWSNRAAREQEQRQWDKHNLKTALRIKLEEFLKEAESVDFSAQTVMQDKKKKFTNPDYERKNNTWKTIYRAGRAPTAAAMELAREWLKSL